MILNIAFPPSTSLTALNKYHSLSLQFIFIFIFLFYYLLEKRGQIITMYILNPKQCQFQLFYLFILFVEEKHSNYFTSWLASQCLFRLYPYIWRTRSFYSILDSFISSENQLVVVLICTSTDFCNTSWRKKMIALLFDDVPGGLTPSKN